MIKNFLQNMNHKSLRHHRIYANHVAKLTDRRKKYILILKWFFIAMQNINNDSYTTSQNCIQTCFSYVLLLKTIILLVITLFSRVLKIY